MGNCAPYARKDGFTPLNKTPKEILTTKGVNFPPHPPIVGTPENQNMNTLYDNFMDQGHINNDCFYLKKQIEEVVDSGKLDHLVKDIRQGGQQNKNAAKGKENVINMVRSYGYQKRRYERMEEWMDNEKEFPSENCQVKYATCTQLDSALTWWNSHVKTLRIDAAYAMTWKELIKMMTEVYCPRNEIQNLEKEAL
ncbi:hypothetical protein Tco_0323050 [Tanacetum coccineum]